MFVKRVVTFLFATAVGCAAFAQDATYSKSGPAGITDWPTGKKLIALTYDDGPNPKITPQLIALLQQKGVKATFYLLSPEAKSSQRLVRQLHDAGFEIGDHGTSHKQLTKLPDDQIRTELSKLDDVVTSVTGEKVRTMRPPYGSVNARVAAICDQMGYKVILWDVDTNDWRSGATKDKLINTIMSQTRDGSIILMHDRFQHSLDATAAVIDPLKARGFEFVTVSELLSEPRLARVSSVTTGTKETTKTKTKAPKQEARTETKAMKAKKATPTPAASHAKVSATRTPTSGWHKGALRGKNADTQ